MKFYESAYVSLPGRIEAVFLIVRIFLYLVLFLGIFALLDRVLHSKRTWEILFKDGEEKNGKPWTPYLVLAGGWLLPLLIKYPTAVWYDTLAMLEQYRAGQVSEHHSVYYTVLMGRLVKIGEHFGNANCGMFLKHPLTYVSATWEQNYYLFMPEVDNIKLYYDIELGPFNGRFDALDGLFDRVDRLGAPKEWIVREFELLHRIPLVRYLGNISFWFYVLIIVTVLSLVFRLDDFILLALSWFTVVFVILGPVIQGHPRYMFPVVYVMPATVLFMLGRMRDKQKNS